MIPKEITLHHTASSRDKTTIADIDAWHKARDFNKSLFGYYIGYHYVITGNGMIQQTRQEDEIGCHCIPNEGKLGIALCGNFDTEQPNPEQLTSLQEVLDGVKKNWNIPDEMIFGHCEKSRTACPGKNLYHWLNLYRQVGLLKKLLLKLRELLSKVGNKTKS